VDRPPPAIPDYELLRRVGRGSYGEVWLARSVTGLYRAVKIIYRDQFEDERPYDREFAGIKRFEPISRANESQVDILHVGRNDIAGYFYYVMELADDASTDDLSGEGLRPETYIAKTLKQVLAARRLTVNETLPLAISLADALAHLHAHGLVHRDIKPSNIIFVNNRPKLADIGLIAATDASGSFVGTEGFVPREGPGTPQADIFALGKVLYETCTGRDRLEFPSLPNDLETLPDRTEMGELNEILLKACDPDPGLRYRSASELKIELELVRAQKSVRRLRTLERTVRRGRKLGVAGIAAGLVIALGWYQSHRFNRLAASQLAHAYVKNGQERLEQNDWLGALPWFAKALELEKGISDREAAHRLRIANTLEWCPQVAALYTHAKSARYAFFDADAHRVLLCETGSAAQIWDLETDQPLTPKLEHSGQPFFGTFSPNGLRVATLSRGDGVARLWDSATGALIGHPILHGKQVIAVSFSPDSRWLATSGEDGQARLWRADDGSDTGDVVVHGAPVSALAFSSDSTRLLTLGGKKDSSAFVRVFDVKTSRFPGPPVKESVSISVAGFRPRDNSLVTGTVSGEICLWKDAPERTVVWRRSMDHAIARLVFDPDGSRLLATSDWGAQLLDSQTGEPMGPLIKSSGMLRSAEFNSDGSLFILAGESRTALVYDGRTGHPRIPVIKHGGEIYDAFFVKGGGWVTASADGTVRRWHSSLGELSRAVFTHSNAVAQLLVTPDSHFIITIDDAGVLRRWSVDSGATAAQEIRALPGAPTAAALTPDGRQIVVAMQGKAMAVVSANDCQTIQTIVAPCDEIVSIVPHPREAKAALRSRDNSVWLWDWQGNNIQRLALSRTGVAGAMAFSPDGKTLAIAVLREVGFVPLARPETQQWAQHQDRVWHIGFADGNRLLASSEDRVMRWWDSQTGAAFSPPIHGDGGIYFAAFSPDQRRVFTSSANYDAMVWDTVTGRPLTPPFKPRPGLTGAAFSPDGHWLAAACGEGSLQVWDASSGEAMTPPLPTLGPLTHCRFSPDGRRLITVEDGRIVVCRPFLLEALSNQQAVTRAELVSGYRVDEQGLLVPLDQVESARIAKANLATEKTP
jgi:WD40 repeat protein